MLPMQLNIASGVFQETMGELFADIDNVVIYINDILIIGTGTFEEHLATVEEVLKKVNEKGVQVNAEKVRGLDQK